MTGRGVRGRGGRLVQPVGLALEPSRTAQLLIDVGTAGDSRTPRRRAHVLRRGPVYRPDAELDPAADAVERREELLLSVCEDLAQCVVAGQLGAEPHGEDGALGHDALDDPLVLPQRVERRISGQIGMAADDGEQLALAHALEGCLREAGALWRGRIRPLADAVDPDHANGVPRAGGSDMPFSSAVATDVMSARR